jgi:hypothetical protein
LQPYGPPRPVTGISLPLTFIATNTHQRRVKDADDGDYWSDVMQIEATYCNTEHSQSLKCVPKTLIMLSIFKGPQAFHACLLVMG